jgi:hypothetical protein
MQFADLQIEKRSKLVDMPPFDAKSLTFGARDTDHMFTVDWTSKKGWQTPKIGPLKPIEMHRFNSTLHCY